MTTRAEGGWVRLPISEIADFGSGDLISVAQLSERSTSCPYPVFGGNGIAGYTSVTTVTSPTVILGRVGQKCGVVYRNTGPAWITDNALYMRRVKRPVDVSYLALALEAARLNDVRNQNDLPLITQAILRDIVIPWPESLEEQRAISFVHADVDAFIAALQRLIAKKEAIREAMVQELMSGSTRLPGFADQWPEVTLSAVATGLRGAGLSKEAVVPSGSKPCILYGELFTTYGRRIGNVVSRTNTGLGIDSQAGDVLIPGSTTTIARDLATASALHTPGVLLGGDINIVRPGKLIDPDWLAYYVTYRLPGRIAEIAQGTTIKHLYVKDILRCRIALPTVEEQREIVAALLDVEEEVSILRRRLKKGGEIRQGIMQQLPTGRTRFYISGEAA